MWSPHVPVRHSLLPAYDYQNNEPLRSNDGVDVINTRMLDGYYGTKGAATPESAAAGPGDFVNPAGTGDLQDADVFTGGLTEGNDVTRMQDANGRIYGAGGMGHISIDDCRDCPLGSYTNDTTKICSRCVLCHDPMHGNLSAEHAHS